PRARDRLVIAIQNHESRSASVQIARQRRAEAAETANDDMIVELAELRVHGADTKNLIELIERDELHQSAGDKDHAGAAKHDRDDGDTSQQRGRDRLNLA